MVMPDLQSQEISLTLAQPGAQGTKQITNFVKWVSGPNGCKHGGVFFHSLLSLPGFLGVPLPHPSPSLQEPTGPSPSRVLAFPLPLPWGCKVCHLLGSVEKSCMLLFMREESLRDGVTRETCSHRGSFICFVCLLFDCGCGFWGVRVRWWGKSWSNEG